MPEPILTPNLASSVKHRRWFKKRLAPNIKRTRIERNSILRPQWLRYRRMWTLRGTEQSYHGRLRLYIPTAHRILENWEQKLKSDLFPQSGRWFKATADSTMDDERSLEVHAMLDKALKRYMKVKDRFPPLLRNLLMLGTSIVDIGWLHEEKLVPTLQQVLKDSKPVTEEAMMKVVLYLGPTFRNVDPFLFYVYPPTVQFINEAQMVFEDQLTEWEALKRMSRTPIDPDDEDLGMQIENFQELADLRKASASSDKFQAEQIRLAERGLRSASELGREDPARPMDTTCLYWKGSILKEEDDDGEESLEPPTWYKLIIGGDDVLLSMRQSPWWDQEPSYLAAKYAELGNEFWGYGLLFLLDHLQYFQNDVWNQTGDGLVFSLNPIVAMDATAIQYPDSIRYSPGARWLLRDPQNSVFMMEPPKDTATVGMAAIQNIGSYMDNVSNVSPSAPQPGPKGGSSKAASSATGMSIMAQDAMLQVREVEESIEGGILTPMLPKMYSRFQQCLDIPILLRLEGRDGSTMVERKLDRDSLIGTYQFEWLGSVFTFNQNVRTQHMLNFVQIVARLPPGALDPDNARIDWRYLLRSIWSNGFGDKEANLVIRDVQNIRSVDADIENQLFAIGRGEEVTVSPDDDDQKHAQEHDDFLKQERRTLDDDVKQEIVKHIQRHAASFVFKQVQKQQQEQQQQLAQQAQQTQLQLAAAGQQPAKPGQSQPGGPGAGGDATAGAGSQPSMTDAGTVMPTAPGRLPSTLSDDDVQRRLPRG